MIIIPFFQKIDWTHPPLITLLLVILNSVIYFTVQSNDSRYTEQAYNYYLDSELPRIELTLYVEHLKIIGQNNKQQQIESALREQEKADLGMIYQMQQDKQFLSKLQNGNYFSENTAYLHWKTLNSEFQNKLNKVVSYKYGLKPDSATLLTYFTNLFLHGSMDHLIGNMIFLFIIGFVVESALGKTTYLMAYLLTGLCGSALYVVFNLGSNIPTIGASGAVAGLMGMYTVLFGLRKINFFYYAFVYFDYIKAPAIILFPLWLGYEFIQLLFDHSNNVNYYAHIGGLCSGALFAFFAKKYLENVDINYLDQDEIKQAKDQLFEKGMDYLAKMQIDKAINLFGTMAQEHPDNRKYLIQWYNAAKLQPASQDYHQAAKQLLKLPDKNPETLKLIRTVFHEYMSKAKPKPLIDTQLLLSVATSLAAGGHPQEADKLLPLLKNHKDKNKLAEATLIIANAFNKTHDYEKYRACLITIVTEHAQTQTAHNANARLRELNITR